MFDQLLIYIPVHETQMLALMGSVCSVLSLIFGLFRKTTWLSKIFGTAAPADLGRVYRYTRLAIKLFLQWREERKIAAQSEKTWTEKCQ